MRRSYFWLLLGAITAVFLLSFALPVRAQDDGNTIDHLVQPGDTWTALAYRYGVAESDLRAARGSINAQRQPAIGATLTLPQVEERTGTLLRPLAGGTVALAAIHNRNPWALALGAGQPHPFAPLLYRPVFLAGGAEPPRELPAGFATLALSQSPARPGDALALRATTPAAASMPTITVPTVALNMKPWSVLRDGRALVAVGATDAFFGSGAPELLIHPPGAPAWSQPWRFVDREWTYQDLTLTGTAAAITAEQIQAERARLFALWAEQTPALHFDSAFQLPLTDYLTVSADYGGRRSYNGGPYRSYHEGVDFSAYGGTPVMAPAAGTVVLAEVLDVRGGAVIIDHGLGIYSGFYHLSSIEAEAGQTVAAGDVVGSVGTTGLSTGNHLHWDLLINGTWVDAAAWLEQDMACWLLEGLQRPCTAAAPELE